MKITGTEEQMNWVINALMNNCIRCPYHDSCNKKAKKDIQEYGEVKNSCEEYLHEQIVFEVEK